MSEIDFEDKGHVFTVSARTVFVAFAAAILFTIALVLFMFWYFNDKLHTRAEAFGALATRFEAICEDRPDDPDCEAGEDIPTFTDEVEVQEPENQEPEAQEPEIQQFEQQDPEIQDPELFDDEVQDPETQDPETQDAEIQDPEVQDPEVDDPDPDDPEVQDPEVDDPDPGISRLILHIGNRTFVCDSNVAGEFECVQQ